MGGVSRDPRTDAMMRAVPWVPLPISSQHVNLLQASLGLARGAGVGERGRTCKEPAEFWKEGSNSEALEVADVRGCSDRGWAVSLGRARTITHSDHQAW